MTRRRLLWPACLLLLLVAWIVFVAIVWLATQAFLGATVLLEIISRGLGG